MCESKGCQHKKESPIKDWKHRCKYGPGGRRLQNGTVIVGWNDLATTHKELAKECLDDATKFTGGSSKRKTWKCKVCGYKRKTPVFKRAERGDGCGCCSGTVCVKGINDCATTHPHLIDECLGDLSKYTAGSAVEIWWKCRVCGHKWKRAIKKRALGGQGCGCCSNKICVPGINDLATTHPEHAKELVGDPTKVIAGTNKELLWKCSACKCRYKKSGCAKIKTKCLNCTRTRGPAIVSFKKSAAYLFPHLVVEHVGPNDLGKLSPKSGAEEDWKCKDCGHEWQAAVATRTRGSGCRPCSYRARAQKQKIVSYEESAAYLYPHIVKSHRGPSDLNSTSPGSGSMENWACEDCGHEWQAPVAARTRGSGCRPCGFRRSAEKRSTAPYEKSLACLFPEIAKELISGDACKIFPKCGLLHEWKCSECSGKWHATPDARITMGSGCPRCNPGGHDQTSPSFVYLIHRPGQIQYGIMNTWTGRLEKHKKIGWELLDKIEVAGQKARSLETKIKQALRAKDIPTGDNAFREWFDGWTEAFQEVDLYVRSIRGLCRKLGINLDAFLAA